VKLVDAQIWSCGGGTQSGAVAALIGDGRLLKPDLCLMVNTGRERSGTWPFVDNFIRPQLARVGLELTVIPAQADGELVSLFSAEGGPLLPGFTTITGKVGKLSPFCSGTWKRDVQERYMRSLGIETATQWLGISCDELKRLRSQHRAWLKITYPLVFMVRMWRVDCVQLIRAKGWAGQIPHSACWMCANADDNEWAEMKRDWPSDFEMACLLEEEVQQRDPHFWLHPSCTPLRYVDFTAQHTMFADRGCTEGCFT
jgi:hypothetical protein